MAAAGGGGGPSNSLAPFPNPAVQSHRCVIHQNDWAVRIGPKKRVLVAVRVWTAGAQLTHLDVDLKGLKLKVGVRFSEHPPWSFFDKYGGKSKQQRVAAANLVTVRKGRTSLVSHANPLKLAPAPGPGYFVIELNNRFNLLRGKDVSDVSWRVDGDAAAPCYAVGTVPVGAKADGVGAPTKEMSLGEAQCVMFLRAAAEREPTLSAAVMPGGIKLVHDTETLLRFSRARKLKAKAALRMLKAHVAWRAQLPAPDSEAVLQERALNRVVYHGRRGPDARHLMIVSTTKFLETTPGQEAYDPGTVVQMQVEMLDRLAAEDAASSWACRGRQVGGSRHGARQLHCM